MEPLLQGKTAVIHGGGGAIGGAVAREFSREGARVFIAGRTQAKLDEVARAIRAAGGMAETAQVAFAASDRASAMTAAIANLSCGSLVD
jgi:3-oxoacyl-[acyl-carrier protein] reductase